MKRLPLTDAAWLQIESGETPMHVAGLQLFEYPEGADDDWLMGAIETMRDIKEVRHPFNQKLHQSIFMDLAPAWVQDNDLDLDYHIRHSALPRPGRVRELLSLVSRLHATPLDRSRPLWECHIIEGLEGNRFAMYTKLHHSVIDGVAGMRLMQTSLTNDPKRTDLPAPFSVQPDQEMKAKKPRREGGFAALSKAIQGQAKTVPTMLRTLKEMSDVVRDKGDPDMVIPYQAPYSILNTRITGARRYAAQSFSLDRIKAVAKKYDGTINDVVMAMSSGCLRGYLDDMNALPDKPLIASVPVSVRPAGSDATGNAISFILANLATDIADPEQRFKKIQTSMNKGKEMLGSMSKAEILNYGVLINAPMILGQFIGTAGRVRPIFNVVISNVPGPREELYWNGAKLTGSYPVSLMVNGQACNITVTSLATSMEFGITACRRTLPHVQRMLDHLETSLAALE